MLLLAMGEGEIERTPVTIDIGPNRELRSQSASLWTSKGRRREREREIEYHLMLTL